MINLPYLLPDRELNLNLSLVLLILDGLAATKRNRLILTLDKTQCYYFLSLHPVVLNRALSLAGKDEFYMDEYEHFTVSSISANVEEYFDRKKIKTLFKILASKEFLNVTYNHKDGFLFDLNELGKEKANSLRGDYFENIRNYIEQMKALQSLSIGKLNGLISSALSSGERHEQ